MCPSVWCSLNADIQHPLETHLAPFPCSAAPTATHLGTRIEASRWPWRQALRVRNRGSVHGIDDTGLEAKAIHIRFALAIYNDHTCGGFARPGHGPVQGSGFGQARGLMDRALGMRSVCLRCMSQK
jgi:hypothetical protein